MKLYRYLDFSGGLRTLKDSVLKVTRPINFNDPFEYLIRMRVNRNTFRKCCLDKIPKKEMDSLVRTKLKEKGIIKPTKRQKQVEYNNIKDDFRKKFENGFNRSSAERAVKRLDLLSPVMGVTCFTENDNNSLMWSHYSDGHKGMVIEFETNIAFKVKPQIIKIKYVEEPPSIIVPYWALKDSNSSTSSVHQKKILGYKHIIWKYEKEYRIQFDVNILRKEKSADGEELLLFDIPKESIRRVVMGCRMSPKCFEELKAILNQSNYRHLKIQRSVAPVSSYKLDYQDL